MKTQPVVAGESCAVSGILSKKLDKDGNAHTVKATIYKWEAQRENNKTIEIRKHENSVVVISSSEETK